MKVTLADTIALNLNYRTSYNAYKYSDLLILHEILNDNIRIIDKLLDSMLKADKKRAKNIKKTVINGVGESIAIGHILLERKDEFTYEYYASKRPPREDIEMAGEELKLFKEGFNKVKILHNRLQLDLDNFSFEHENNFHNIHDYFSLLKVYYETIGAIDHFADKL